jgi:hypothetical protein
MKKFLPFILIAIVTAQLFAPFSVGMGVKNDSGITINKAEAADCEITNVIFADSTGAPLVDEKAMFNKDIPRLDSVMMKVETSDDCIGKDIAIRISASNEDIEFGSNKYKVDKNNFNFTLKTGESMCEGKSCDRVKFIIYIYKGETLENLKNIDKTLKYQCLGKDNTNEILCNSGQGDFKWGIIEPAPLPLTDQTNDLGDKWHYSIKRYYTSTNESPTTMSADFTGATAETDCKADRALKEKELVSSETLIYSISPCTKYTDEDKTFIDVYYFEATDTTGNMTPHEYSTLALCNEGRTKWLTDNPGGKASECTTKKIVQVTGGMTTVNPPVNNLSELPQCSIIPARIGGCIAQGLYYLFFKTTSFIFNLAGKILDFTVMYSISDDSYRSSFVVEGWGIVRDFCNMFFIFVLLYIAIGTILNIHSVKTKEMIINVVIIGLLINFSLFATQVIIDASNILTRVFYNPQTIITGQKDASGNVVGETGDFGEIKLSEAIVSKVDPQKLIIQAKEVNNIPIRGTNAGEETEPTKDGVTTGTFILVVLLATAVNVVGLFVFITIAFIFIGRVIGLWLAMILAPIAFFSYTVPALQSIQMIGWKHWWSDTLKMAFMAPVFAFFMYLIVGFMDKGLGIIDVLNKNRTGIDLVVSIIVPFIFIMALLIKAKDITKSMSGQIGDAMASAGSKIGGLALGAGLGGLAMAGRATVGRVADKVATSNWAQTHGRFGRMVGDAGKWTASKSFDVRATGLGGQAGKALGTDLGKAKEGGYTKHKEEVFEKRRARAESLKLGNMSPEVQELHGAEEELSNLKNESINDTTRIEGTIDARRKTQSSQSRIVLALRDDIRDLERKEKEGNPLNKEESEKLENEKAELEKATQELLVTSRQIQKLEAEKKDLREAKGKYADRTGDGKVNEEAYYDYKKEVVDVAEFELVDNLAKETAKLDKATTEKEKTAIKDKMNEMKAEYAEIQKTWKRMQDSVDKLGFANKGEVRSLDKLEFKIVPDAHHHVEHINAERINKYATEIRGRMFNSEANDKAAHEAVMRAEVKKH